MAKMTPKPKPRKCPGCGMMMKGNGKCTNCGGKGAKMGKGY